MLSWQTFGGLTMTLQRFKQLSPLLVGNFANNSEDKTNLAFRATVQSEVEFVHEVTAAVTARIYPNQKYYGQYICLNYEKLPTYTFFVRRKSAR